MMRYVVNACVTQMLRVLAVCLGVSWVIGLALGWLIWG